MIPSQLVEQSKLVACSIWSVSPARLLAGFPSIVPTAATRFGNFMNDFCGNEFPGFDPPSARLGRQGGKCPTLYNFSRSWRAINRDNGQVDSRSQTSQIIDPVTILGILSPTPGFRGAFARSGEGLTIQLTDIYSDAQWRNFSWTPGSFVRVDGLEDNCGEERLDFLPPTVEEGDENGIEFPFNVSFEPGININIPVTLLPRIGPPAIDIAVNGKLEFSFNVEGINLNFGGGGGSDVDIQPILDELLNITFDMTVNQEALVNKLDNVIDISETITEAVDGVSDAVEGIVEDVAVLGEPVPLETTAETDPCLTLDVTPPTLFQALRLLSQELVEERQRLCGEQLGAEELVAEGESSIPERSFYVPLNARAAIVRLELVGDIPLRANYSQTNEATGTFGAISQTGLSNAVGQTQTVFTRNTVLVLDDEFAFKSVRVFLVPGIQWRLFVQLRN